MGRKFDFLWRAEAKGNSGFECGTGVGEEASDESSASIFAFFGRMFAKFSVKDDIGKERDKLEANEGEEAKEARLEVMEEVREVERKLRL